MARQLTYLHEIYLVSTEDALVFNGQPARAVRTARINTHERTITFPALTVSFADVLKIARAIVDMEIHERV